MNPPFSTLIFKASLTLGRPPSLRATVKLDKLWCSCGERRTRLRISFFCDMLSAWMAAWTVSELGSASERSAASWERRRMAGGRCERSASMKAVSPASMTGMVLEEERRSASVVNRLPWACAWDALPPALRELRKF